MNRLCPRCEVEKDEEDFGVARARKGGRNLYCKACCVRMMYIHREANRRRAEELRIARGLPPKPEPPRKVWVSKVLTVEERRLELVREAIKAGHRTREAINQS